MANQDFSDIAALIPKAESPSSAKAAPESTATPSQPEAPDFSDVASLIPKTQAKQGSAVDAFVSQYAPLADRVSKQTGVAPEALLGQWGLETGWGKSVIPGTNNLGNMKAGKSWTGATVSATDNATKSVDPYRSYDSVEAFGDDFVGRMSQQFKSARGSGSDAQRYFTALKSAGYAEDPEYVNKGVSATRMAAQAMGRKAPEQPGTANYGNTYKEPVQPTSVFGDIWSGVKHGAGVTLPKSAGEAAKFFGADGVGDTLTNFAKTNETDDTQESAYGKSLDSPYSIRGNAYEAADNSVLSLAPGAAGAAAGFAIGGPIGALIGYGVGSIASLPIFYGSQGQQTYDKVKKAQIDAGSTPEIAEQKAREAGHLSGGIEAGGELVSDLIPFGKLFKPFVKPAAKVTGSVVKDMFFPTLKQAGKGVALTEAGEITTEMAQQTGEDAVEGAYGAGPGATWDNTSRVIMPTALMTLIPGLAGAASKHAQVNATRKALENPETPPEVRAKLAAAATSEMASASEDTARNFALYSGKQIQDGAPIQIADDAFYAAQAAQISPDTRVDPALRPVADAAAKGGTLSKAAMAGVTASGQLSQDAVEQPTVDPMTRLAELEAIGLDQPDQKVIDQDGNPITVPGSRGRIFTQEEKAEYDSLRALRDSTPGMTPEDKQAKTSGVDEILNRVTTIESALQDNGLSAFRQEDSPVSVKQLLGDLATAKSKSTPARTREQALHRLEFAAKWAGFDQPATEPASTKPNEGWDDISKSEQPVEMSAPAAADNSSPVIQQTVDQATEGLPRAEIPAVPAGEAPSASNTAQRRKRKAQLRQLADLGFDDVIRDGNTFTFVNTRKNQRVTLDNAAEAALARASITESWNDKAHAAATSPKNDLSEPTERNIDTGNWKRGETHPVYGALFRSESPPGSQRKGVDKDGNPWEITMAHNYGEFTESEGADGDPVDGFVLGPGPIWVIDQVNKDGSFDEHKIVVGPRTEEEARAAYLANYEAGWTGLGAITQIPKDGLRGFLKNHSKAPLALGKESKTYTVTDGGEPVQLMKLDTNEIGDASAPRTGKGKFIAKKDADLIKAIAKMFGVNVQFFRSITPGFNSDGFFNGGNTLHLSERTTIHPLAVFGHEFMHLIKSRNAKAYESIAKVVAANVKDPKGYRKDYYGEEHANQHGDAPLTSAELEEIVSDLNGNLMLDSKFWRDVFAQIATDHGSEAKGIIAQLSALLSKTIDAIVSGLKGQPYNAGQFVNNTKEIRAAFKNGLAQYLGETGSSKSAVQAEILRAEQKAKGADVKRSSDKIVDESINEEKGNGNFYQDLRQRVERSADGRGAGIYHESELVSSLIGGDQTSGREGSVINSYQDVPGGASQAVIRWDGKLGGINGYLTSSYIGRTTDGDAFIFSAVPNEIFGGESPGAKDIARENLQGNAIVDIRILKSNSGDYSLSVGSPARDSETAKLLGNNLKPTGRFGSSGDEYMRVTIGTKATRQLLREAIRRFAIYTGGHVPNIEFVRDTGSNPSSEINLYSAAEIEAKFSKQRPDDGLTVEAYHYSQQPRSMLTTAAYGTGLKGSDREEIQNASDKRLRDRLYFYVNKGTGIRPEAGVGGIAHKATLDGIYDADADAKRLKQGANKRAFESAVLDAGYKGYLSRLEGSQPGQVILLGSHDIKPEATFQSNSIADAKQVPAGPVREMDLGDKIMANKNLPSGQLAPDRWMSTLSRFMPAEAAEILDVSALGDKPLYKDELVAKLRKAQPEIKRSAQRAQDEYTEVEAKYKGTDQWMKTPGGEPTLLTERQWVQVRTPSFIKWFGPWEKYAAEGKNVWHDASGEVSKVVGKNGEPLVVYHGTDKGGFTEFDTPGGTKRGDLGIWTTPDYGMASSYVRKGRAKSVDLSTPGRSDLEDAGFEFLDHTDDDVNPGYFYSDHEGYEHGPFLSEKESIDAAAIGFEGEAGTTPGVYALFVNIRDPNESNFEGAMWSGERPEQWSIDIGDGEPYVDPLTGKQYFSEDEARAIAKEFAAPDDEYEGADFLRAAEDHFETTDDVVRDARRNKNDGAIIREVVDYGGGTGYWMDPQDIFVAFDPSQLKSADYNNGEFKDSTGDLRKSTQRPAIRHGSQLKRDDEMEMSTRTPTAAEKKNFTPEDSKKNLLISDFASSAGQTKWIDSVAELVSQYPNYRNAPSADTSSKQLERLVRQMADNLIWLHDKVPSDIRQRSKLWYDGAHAIAGRMSSEYGITKAQSAGILAALSPQKDWFMNVSLAQRVAEIMSKEGSTQWDSKMDATAGRIFGKQAYQEDLDSIRGLPLDEMSNDVLRAMWVRIQDEAHNSRSFQIVSPEGESLGAALTKSGKESKVAWGSIGEIAKAVSIFKDGSADNINAKLGQKHKVRNFYNNILVPLSKNGHVTIDTHAVAAALLRPLSGNSLEVTHNFGGPSNAATGLVGTYALYEEAYRRAAEQLGHLPRELQSITWEAIRGLYRPTFKSQQKNVDTIDKIWTSYKKGRLSHEQAREQSFAAAGGIESPGWVGPSPRAYVEDREALESGDLAESQLPRSRSVNTGSRGVGRDSGASARVASIGADDLSVREPGGLRRSTGRVARTSRTDQGYEGREEDGSLSGLPRDIKVDGRRLDVSHWAPAEEVARRYMADAGIDYIPPAKYVKADPERGKRIADAYEAMKHEPRKPAVKAAYAALAKETIAQYQAVVDSGLEVEFINFAEQGDPYKASPRLATEDVRNNNHMWVFSTRDGFGSDESFSPDDNPLLAETKFKISGKPALVNDLFRVVHDYFGHVKEGVGFRADGEENTWRSHSAMFTPLAQRALTSETRGQNSWVNFGPYGDHNRTASSEDTHFADQKVGLLPEWVSEEGRHDDPVYADSIEPSAAKGRKVIQEVEIEETGKTAKLSVGAETSLDGYNARIDAMKKLLGCLKR